MAAVPPPWPPTRRPWHEVTWFLSPHALTPACRHRHRWQVNPLLFASLYAENRADTAPLLKAWLKKGHNVILDRYVEANFGHQASKLPMAERPALIEQLTAFEHDWLDLPRCPCVSSDSDSGGGRRDGRHRLPADRRATAALTHAAPPAHESVVH